MIIEQDNPARPEIVRLIEELDAYQSSLYPPESNHFLSIDELLRDEIYFASVRVEGEVVGIGALKKCGDYAEVKRMYVPQRLRSRGISRAVMAHLESHARAVGIPFLRLETGIKQDAALALYEKCGFVRIGPFGDYAEDPLSVFMEKRLYC
ncbi:putative acetyltransferase [Formivibrio citricus]|uniref:Putative acetyltransferase n=1 Tax=Formivibrio citricus TaxID=83765 RepID=A0A1I4VYR3_9NEIS|nr:GNAT family N-acetyltransferase [Formivibrio citricus]SFN06079.1 putative acetyltransferase [Formivibrio citricus]